MNYDMIKMMKAMTYRTLMDFYLKHKHELTQPMRDDMVDVLISKYEPQLEATIAI